MLLFHPGGHEDPGGDGGAEVGQTALVASLDRTQLSSIADGVDDLTRRVAHLAEQLEERHQADAAGALFEAERSLRMASRAVERARRALPA